jgi:hexosaminidase
MRYIAFLTICIAMLWNFSSCKKSENQVNIIPVPVEIKINSGHFTINGRTDILINSSDPDVKMVADGLSAKLSSFTGKNLSVNQLKGSQPGHSILLRLDESLAGELGTEGYKLIVKSSKIEVIAAKANGLFYGVETIYQLLPPEVFGDPSKISNKDLALNVPCVEIRDFPSFSWRGMHLDVSRHFFPKEFVKKYIDLIAMHKMNTFHWHLTDDNGWRIQIDKYPKLTEVAAWRADREDQPWEGRQPQRPGEKATYGGFYTKEDIKEIVEYARERFITIIPEIEMPGHTSEVFSAYPELSCSGETIPVNVGSYWPNTDIFCAGKEATFRFIEGVLDEVAEMFPSEYIHIGGDEADKTAWRACPDCKARIREQGLSSVEELQSYFVKRVEKYLVSKGKKLIGWDEILQGGLAPEATVMSWQGFEGGIEAARQGHKVIMCPTSYCYLDYYQADPDFQPKSIGGLVTLKKVYSFRPIPAELQGPDRKLILGGQGNLWTEYVPTPEHAEYMVLPRMTALAEILWSPESKLNWDDFRSRLQEQFARFRSIPANYCEGSGKVEATGVSGQPGQPYSIKLETEVPGTEIYYSLDGTTPTLRSFKYKDPVKVDRDLNLKALAFKNNEPLERNAVYNILYHKAVGKPVSYKEKFSDQYPASGFSGLNDGFKGSLNFADGKWQGYYGNNMDVVISLGQDFTFTYINTSFLLDQKRWIFPPQVVNYYVSEDGQNFQRIASITHKIPLDNEQALSNDFSVKVDRPMKVNFLRVEAVNIGVCPDWHPAKGQKAWLFADEIVVK